MPVRPSVTLQPRALDCVEHNHRGDPGAAFGIFDRVVNGGYVMSVHLNRVPAEILEFTAQISQR